MKYLGIVIAAIMVFSSGYFTARHDNRIDNTARVEQIKETEERITLEAKKTFDTRYNEMWEKKSAIVMDRCINTYDLVASMRKY